MPAKPAGGGNSIESERDREADWRRKNQKKERRLKKKAKRRQTNTEVAWNRSRKAEGSCGAAQKAEESRRKIESGSIEWLRVAESRQKKKGESRSKN